MKNILISLALSVPLCSFTQPPDSASRKSTHNNWYINAGLGYAYTRSMSNGVQFSLGAEYAANRHHIICNYTFINGFVLFNEDYFDFHSFRLLYGYGFTKKKWFLMPQAGIAWNLMILRDNMGGGGLLDDSGPDYHSIKQDEGPGAVLAIRGGYTIKRWSWGIELTDTFGAVENIFTVGGLFRFRIGGKQ